MAYYKMITVQPPLSEPLWPAPKSTSSDNRESIFDVQLTTPTPISHIYHRLTVFYPILAENDSSLMLYTTFLNIILALLSFT